MLPETPPTPSPIGRRRRHPSRQNVRTTWTSLAVPAPTVHRGETVPRTVPGSPQPGASACRIRLLDGNAWGQACSLGIAGAVALPFECVERRDDSSDPFVRAATPITTTQSSTSSGETSGRIWFHALLCDRLAPQRPNVPITTDNYYERSRGLQSPGTHADIIRPVVRTDCRRNPHNHRPDALAQRAPRAVAGLGARRHSVA